MDEAKDLDITQDVKEAAALSRETPIKKGWGKFSPWELNKIKEGFHGAFDELELKYSSTDTVASDPGTRFQQAAESDVKIKTLDVEKEPTHLISDPISKQAQSDKSDQLDKAA